MAKRRKSDEKSEGGAAAKTATAVEALAPAWDHEALEDYPAILAEVVALIETARRAAARAVDSVMASTCWLVGRRVAVQWVSNYRKRLQTSGYRLQERRSALLRTTRIPWKYVFLLLKPEV
ncbi:MAG: hypothetical protein FJ125_14250 [Deltaproteobacteria bacterium]|nr:hypothetical protein [Deltaproteobacteria bacterium]